MTIEISGTESLADIIHVIVVNLSFKFHYKWSPPSLSELTPIIFNTELTHLGSDASNYIPLYNHLSSISKTYISFIVPKWLRINIIIIYFYNDYYTLY